MTVLLYTVTSDICMVYQVGRLEPYIKLRANYSVTVKVAVVGRVTDWEQLRVAVRIRVSWSS